MGNSRKNYWELLGNYWPMPSDGCRRATGARQAGDGRAPYWRRVGMPFSATVQPTTTARRPIPPSRKKRLIPPSRKNRGGRGGLVGCGGGGLDIILSSRPSPEQLSDGANKWNLIFPIYIRDVTFGCLGLGVSQLCSKICLLCYATVLEKGTYYAQHLCLLCLIFFQLCSSKYS